MKKGSDKMKHKISVDHCPSLVFEDWDSAAETARKLNRYIYVCLIEFNGEEIGYGLYNSGNETLLEKEDAIMKKLNE